MRKGFTLIELLAVIVVLAIVALIATPRVLSSLEQAQKNAFKSTANNIAYAAEFDYSNKVLKNDPLECRIYTFVDGEFSHPGLDIEIKGRKPQSGTLIVSEEGKVAYALHNGKYCATKDYNELAPTVFESTEEDCGGGTIAQISDMITNSEGHELVLLASGNVYIRTYGHIISEFTKIDDVSNVIKIGNLDNDLFYAIDNNNDFKIIDRVVENFVSTTYLSNVKDYYDIDSNYQLWLMTDGTVMGEGYINGDYINLVQTPTAITGLSNVNKIVVDDNAFFAILNDGTVMGWGYINGYDNNYVETPTVINGLANVDNILISEYAYDNGSTTTNVASFMAVLDNGNIMTWGFNENFALGLGHNNNVATPTIHPHLTNLIQYTENYSEAIADSPEYEFYAIRDDYSSYMWGTVVLPSAENFMSPTMIPTLISTPQLVYDQIKKIETNKTVSGDKIDAIVTVDKVFINQQHFGYPDDTMNAVIGNVMMNGLTLPSEYQYLEPNIMCMLGATGPQDQMMCLQGLNEIETNMVMFFFIELVVDISKEIGPVYSMSLNNLMLVENLDVSDKTVVNLTNKSYEGTGHWFEDRNLYGSPINIPTDVGEVILVAYSNSEYWIVGNKEILPVSFIGGETSNALIYRQLISDFESGGSLVCPGEGE